MTGSLINQCLCVIWAEGKIVWVERMIYCHPTKMQHGLLSTKSELHRGNEPPVKDYNGTVKNCRQWRRFFELIATHLQTIFLLAVSTSPWTFPYPQLPTRDGSRSHCTAGLNRQDQEVYQYWHSVSQAGSWPNVGCHNQDLFFHPFPK